MYDRIPFTQANRAEPSSSELPLPAVFPRLYDEVALGRLPQQNCWVACEPLRCLWRRIEEGWRNFSGEREGLGGAKQRFRVQFPPTLEASTTVPVSVAKFLLHTHISDRCSSLGRPLDCVPLLLPVDKCSSRTYCGRLERQ